MNRSIIGAAACTVLLALTACGGSGDAPEGGDGAAPVTLVVWESLEGRSDFIKQAGAAYTALHPEVTISYKNVELGDAPAQIALDGPAGVGPDVFAAPSNSVGELVAGGHVLPVADPEALRADLLAGAVQNVTYEDELWAVPVTIDTYALFYNKDLVSEAPTTWKGVLETAREFNAANPGKYGFVMQPNTYYAAMFMFTSPDNLPFGPDLTDPTTPNVDTPATIAGLEEYVTLREVLDVPAADLDVASIDALFEGGQSAMTISGSWNIPVFDDAGLNYGVTTLPARSGSEEPSGSFANSRAMYVSAYGDHPDEAQDFAAFLATPEMLQLAYEITGSVPSADLPVDSEQTLGLMAQGEFAFPSPSIPEATNFYTVMDSAVANIWNGADIRSELAAADAAILGR